MVKKIYHLFKLTFVYLNYIGKFNKNLPDMYLIKLLLMNFGLKNEDSLLTWPSVSSPFTDISFDSESLSLSSSARLNLCKNIMIQLCFSLNYVGIP